MRQKEKRVFVYKGRNEKIIKAVQRANNPSLINRVTSRIMNSEPYEMSNCPPDKIAYLYSKFMQRNVITIESYYNRFTRARGYFSSNKPKTININMAKRWDEIQIISLSYHESGHAWDASEKDFKVNHGNNSPVGKENTFQYSLNRYVYELFGYKKEPRKGFWRRVLSFLMGIK